MINYNNYKLQWNLLRELITSEAKGDKTETLARTLDWFNSIENVVLKYMPNDESIYFVCWKVFGGIIFEQMQYYGHIKEDDDVADEFRMIIKFILSIDRGMRNADDIKKMNEDEKE